MKFAVSLLAVSIGLAVAAAAPALGERPSRWEYAELHAQRSVAPLRIAPGAGVANPPAAPGAALTLRWATADEEFTAES